MADTRLQGKWVLIVDDDEAIVQALDATLARLGLRRVVAHSVNEALSKLRKQRFDLVLLDFHLPQGNGEAILNQMRVPKDHNQETPVLVMSGSLDAALIMRIRQHVAGVLVKPFNMSFLAGKVSFVLTGESTGEIETPPVQPRTRAA